MILVNLVLMKIQRKVARKMQLDSLDIKVLRENFS